MSVVHNSLIARKRNAVRTRSVEIPWPAISVALLLAGTLLAAILVRLYVIQRSAVVAIVEPTLENRILSQSYRGPVSNVIGGSLFDAVETVGERYDAAQTKAKMTEAATLFVTGEAITPLAHNPRPFEQLIIQLQSYGIDPQNESLKLLATKRGAHAAPIDLPDAVELRKLRVTTGAIGTLQFDVVSKNEHVDGLTLADIAVKDSDGKEWAYIALEQIVSPLADHTIVVLVDRSSSMADRLGKLQAALEMFIANCSTSTRLAIVGFDSKVTSLTTLTNDHRVLTDAVRSIVVNGNTEITKALDYANRVLSGTPGFRSILLCTDGIDPELAKNLQRIVADCEQARISVNVLALEDATLDKSNLALLAQRTRGQLCLADNPLSINEQMNKIIGLYSAPSYRLYVFNPSRKLDRYRMFLVNRPELFIDVQP